MGLKEKLDEDLKLAMKAKDELKLSTVRLLKNAISNAEIAKKKTLTDDDIITVIQSSIKQRKDSIEQYTQGGRSELAVQEETEMKILQAYLPEQLSEEEVRKFVLDVIKETGAASVKEMGKVMGKLMPLVKGKADSSLVSLIVKEHLK
ncbi:MAG: aspartyl-tRNA amidotransferase [Candidatus Firestonebacteria bacterium RIFOXYC2_FULL_39_67]|nr:MAG: aspartyl-tRNA amidotransferase [Candidatus Firestonebacteria bacterium RIFOXYD2_FULL_39_29]OGF54903.1 MAG: aspartyl-tRNA amidotransferase [Candidatus Firestonebacteria bacterium RIFOXYC2_FULL_39_67]OGF57749.1 MAG: aspartyl-tRNA amidotransferase [Candidatus Firestonebacteria bacterium RifOxyC12_full_39_7]